jgi:Hsp20/alpha crystallin family
MPVRMGIGSTFAQVRCDHRSEMIHPAPDGLIGDRDPAFRQQIFDVAETQREAEIEPDRVLDDFGREAIAAIADFERRGRYGYRSVAPPTYKAVDTDKVEANFNKGVLTVTLPKKPEAQEPEKKIEVKPT